MTHRQHVLGMLLDSDEVCGTEFYAAYLPRFSVQIHLLRRDGWLIDKRPCDRHAHDHTAWLYSLEAPPDMRMSPPTQLRLLDERRSR